MFERFTESSRRVVVLAQEEARMLDHNYIGTEHILLGLIHEGEGVAARAIVSLGLTLEMAREQVRELVGAGTSTPTGHIPFTPPAKKVLELSLREALALKKEYIGTEHILLGLVHEGQGAGAQILATTAPLPAVREKVLLLAAAAESNEPGPDEQRAMEWLTGLRAGEAGLRLPPRAVVSVRAQVVSEFRETLTSIGETLAALEHRLTGIERRLGITPPAPEEGSEGPDEPAQPPGEADQSPDAAAQGPGESTDAPEDDAPEESAE
jgi:ATP-dependent Clp protease ATP-binding subunit ClpA